MGGDEVAVFLGVRGAVAPALLFALGIALPCSSERGLVALAIALGVSMVLGWLRQPGSFLALLAGFAFAGAALAGERMQPGSVPDWMTDGAEAVLEGQVESSGPFDARLLIDAVGPAGSAQLQAARLRFRVSGPFAEVQPGERLRLLVRVFETRPPSNPGEPDRVEQDREQAIDRHGAMRPGERLILAPAPSWAQMAQRVRKRFVDEAERAVPDPRARALVVALGVGERTGLDPETNEHFNASGLAHILSVSGLHVAVVAFGLAWLLRWIFARSRLWGRRGAGVRIANALTVPALWAYVLLTGAEVPAVRSGIMCTALVLARVLRRESEGYSALALAAMAVLASDSTALYDVSFQLSFAAVLGLMALAGPLHEWARGGAEAAPALTATSTRWERGIERLRRIVIGGVCTSIAAALATAPLVARVFHRESLVSAGANLMALPVASALTAVAAAAAALTPIAPACRLLLPVAGWLAHALLAVADAFGTLPFAQVRVAEPPLATTVAYYLTLAMIPHLANSRPARRVAWGSALALTLLGAWRTVRPHVDSDLEVTFLSVGQGDSTFIRFPGGASWLIDGGGVPAGHFDLGAAILAPFLWERGVDRLDVIAMSHPHPDHALGLIGLAPLVGTRELWMSSGIEAGGLVHDLEAAVGPGTVERHLTAGSHFEEGPVKIDVLGPPPGPPFAKVNDQSLVLMVTYGDVRFLLPGDAEEDAEEALLALGVDLHATVLKAPHHGSGTSSTAAFVHAVHPASVIFCVGRENRFGFPLEAVQDRYRDEGARLFRTDLDGAVTFHTDGHTLSVDRFLAPSATSP